MKKLWDKNKTLRQKKKHDKGTRRWELHKHSKLTLGSGDLQNAVRLPEGEDTTEWLAVNTVDFFNQVNLLYGSVTVFCTTQSCPIMAAGKHTYLWGEDKGKKPREVSAPEYVDLLMTWIQNLLDDDTVFPKSVEVPFPKNFKENVKAIFRRLFRVYAHIYYAHFDKIRELNEEAHLNTCFKHYFHFVREFDLVRLDEMAPLKELMQSLGLIARE